MVSNLLTVLKKLKIQVQYKNINIIKYKNNKNIKTKK